MQSLQKPGQPYGTPHYVNTQYPWDGHEKLHPGEIPQDYNPIGEYQSSFTLPENWAGLQPAPERCRQCRRRLVQ